MLEQYDPEIAPDAAAWEALDENERIELVMDFHREARIPLPKSARTTHAALHVAVENQLILNDPPEAAEALQRLMQEGLPRHEALHAVCSVLAEHLYALMKNPDAPQDQAVYAAGLEQITAARWLNGE